MRDGTVLLVLLLLVVPVLLPPVPSAPPEQGASGRAGEDAIEWVNPVPTGSTLYGIAWRPGADDALLVGQSGTVVKYNPFSTPKFFQLQSGVSESLRAIAYQPGGATALIAGTAGMVLKYDGTTFTPMASGTSRTLNDIAWKPDGSAALIAGDDGTILLFDGNSISRINTTSGSDLWGAAWAPSGDLALLVGQGGAAFSCNLTSAVPVGTGATSDLHDVSYFPDGSHATVVGAGGAVLKYDGQSFRTVGTLANQAFNAVAWSPDGARALLVGWDSGANGASAYTLDASGALASLPNAITVPLRAVAWEPEQPIALVAGSSGMVAEYGAGGFAVLSSVLAVELAASAWRPDGSYALVAGAAGYLAKFDGGQLTAVPTGVQSDLKGVAWCPTRDYALACGRTGAVLKFHAGNSTAETLATGLSPAINFTAVSWKPDGSYALLVGDDGLIVKYNGTGFELQQVLNVMLSVNYLDIAWKPDGAYAIIGGVSGNILKYEERGFPPPLDFCVTKAGSAGSPGTAFFSVSWRNATGVTEALVSGTNGVVVRLNETGLFQLSTDTTRSLYGIAWMPASGYALAVGQFGKLLKYVGYGFIQPASGTDINFLDIAWKPDGSYALLLGQSGTLVKYSIAKRTSPRALISSPRTGTVFEPGTSILFDCSNSTPTYGDSLTFHWESNLSGGIGEGPRFSKVLGAGRHRITLYANDTQGHSATDSVLVTVKAPNRAPVIVLNSPEEGSVFNNTDEVAFDASGSFDPDGDPLSFHWTSSRSGFLSSSPAFTAKFNIGSYLITLWLNDSMGYNVSRMVNITVVLFNRPPSPRISSPSGDVNYTNKEPILFDASASSDPDEDELYFFWTSNVSGYLASSRKFTRSLAVGDHRVTVWADDAKGGNRSASVNITVRKANEAPGVTVDYPAEGAVVKGTVEFSGVALDPELEPVLVSYQIDDGGWQAANGTRAWSFSIDTTALDNGRHVVRVKASDASEESPEVTLNLTVHNPFWGFSVSVLIPLDGATVEGTVKLEGNASRVRSSILRVEVKIDDGDWIVAEGTSLWTYSWDTTKVKNGPHRITVRANDSVDNSPETSMVLKVENQPSPGAPWTAMGLALVVGLVLIVAAVAVYALRRRPAAAAGKAPKGSDEEE